MDRPLDILFIHPGEAHAIYQGLSRDVSAIEPPTWCLLLAESCRSKGYGVAILDCDAERLTVEQAVSRILELKPRIACFVVYGQNPNAGTTKMTGALPVASLLKSTSDIKTVFVGSHVSAMPEEVLAFRCVDAVAIGDGVYTIHRLLESKNFGEVKSSYGSVLQERMDIDLPGMAWDLLPYCSKPFDLYRSCNWHADFDESRRTPYASIYTSLGCFARCSFCMINLINRTSLAPSVTAADSPGMRYWSKDWVMRQMDKLNDYGVTTIRIADEMFFFNKRHYVPLLQGISGRYYSDKLHMWAYARVDTVKEEQLDLFYQAGIKWLALGVEAANRTIRQDIAKGSYEEVDVKDVVRKIHNAGINVIANYIFGLPHDTRKSMAETYAMAEELNTEMVNFYPAMALPGSPLYQQALQEGQVLPDSYEGYSFHSYECQPLRTKELEAWEILKYRDDAWKAYFSNPKFLGMIESKFGLHARYYIEALSKIELRRRLIHGTSARIQAANIHAE